MIDLSDDSFDERVAKLRGPILVNFWASWCPPCKVLEDALRALEEDRAGRVTVARVNVEDNGLLTSRFGIRKVPTLLLLENGRVAGQLVGAAPRSEVERLLDEP